jgi:hypothetical protein
MNGRTRKPQAKRETTDAMIEQLQKETFDYFLHEANPQNGLLRDRTSEDSPASIAATGLALTAYPIGVERGFWTRRQAVDRTLSTVRFFANSKQESGPDSTGFKGFYYHFLDMATGRRVWKCELSTIDTALLMAGMLAAAAYFDKHDPAEREIRERVESLYQKVDWKWAQNGGASLSHGWKPESGFFKARWEGFSEALILYILALGSPTCPVPPSSYSAWCNDFKWKKIFDRECLYAGPLFIHQLSHIWLDLRGVRDHFTGQKSIDLFENSRRATYVQQQYAIRNPFNFDGYGEHSWGFTASDGPGPKTEKVDGIDREFYGYKARGVPFGPDDGTIAPWAVVASLPFAPEIVLPTIEYFNGLNLRVDNQYGFKATYNPTFPGRKTGSKFWISKHHYGLNQGPVVIMAENYRSQMTLELMKKCPYVVAGLKKAGFKGGWLNKKNNAVLTQQTKR